MVLYVAILLYSFFEIFMIMYLANEITIESDQLSYCLFESNWFDQSESTKKCVIILCEMIKKPHQLKVFIYPMNLEKFTSVSRESRIIYCYSIEIHFFFVALQILNGAYSMFNILKSFK